MDRLLVQNEDLLSIAALHARDVDALCTDVAAIIFPTAMHPPTDATIGAVSSKLLQVVSEIECKLTGATLESGMLPATWPLLAQSGFLREADLVDFMLARVSEDRLDDRLSPTKFDLTVELLDHSDGNVADAAQLLLAADSLYRRSRGSSHLILRPELLHKLCWRIVAAIEVSHGGRSTEIITAARQIIHSYDEAYTAASAARKIVHFIGDSHRAELLDPEKCGLHLFVATIAVELNLDHDHVLRLLDCGSSAPLALMLAAVGLPKQDASARLLLLRGKALTSREAAIFDKSYDLVERDAAVAEIGAWSLSRSSYLTFGNI